MRANRNGPALLLLSVLAILLIPTFSAAEEFPETMIILDGSGSMWGDLGGERKIEAAKRVLAEVVPGLPPEVRVGFAAYGHRREKDCSDVEILVPPGSTDREGLVAKAEAITPKGMTPIARACREVAELLRGREAETTVILVSDGIETCDEDPCEVVRALKEGGVRFVMHVVGFGVDEDARAQLECIAGAGEGRYFDASAADSLLAAFETMKGEIVRKVEKAKTTVVKASTGLGKLRLILPESGLVSLAGLKIEKPDGAVVKEAELGGGDTTHPLLAGEYGLALAFANSNYSDPTEVALAPFSVAGGETTTVSLGVVLFNVADGLADRNLDAVSLITATGDTLVTIRETGNDYYLLKPKPAPPGLYSVAFHYYRSPPPAIIAEAVEVRSGEETVVTLDAGIALDRTESKVTGWNLTPSGAGEPLLQVRRGRDNDEPLWRRFIVPPGTYDLAVLVDGMNEPLPIAQGIEIKSGETLRFATGL